jgi:hypothetical protein
MFMRFRFQSRVIELVGLAAMALMWQGMAAAQDDGALRSAAFRREFVTASAPRTEPRMETNRPGRMLWIASVVALGVANAADARSSWSKDEGNQVLAGRGGTFGAKGVAIKGGINVAWIVGQVIALRKNQAYRPMAIANFGAASIFGALAYRNGSIPAPASGLR